MMNLAAQLDAARAEVNRLERIAAAATCVELGRHDWRSDGGCSAGCKPDCDCSVPVNTCRRCKDCDYGQNEEADEVKRLCAERRAEEKARYAAMEAEQKP